MKILSAPNASILAADSHSKGTNTVVSRENCRNNSPSMTGTDAN